ncbi:MAG: phosphatidate cytidylyltransferase [Planctomycetota bacterium]|nr:phosphatidate cytidylyltransferase [Planctomycetota bacterium]
MTSPRAAKIWKRTWIGSTQVAVLALLVWLGSGVDGGLVILVATWLIALAATFEVHRMGTLAARGVFWILAPAHLWVGYWTLLGLGLGGSPPPLFLLGGVLAWAVFGRTIYVGIFRRARLWEIREYAVDTGLALWLVLPLPLLTHVWTDYGIRGVIGLVLLSKIGDTAGYYVGSAIGRRHPFPRISPGKTVAGCVSSLMAGILAGVVAVQTGLLPEAGLGLLGGALAGAVINVAAQAGDLLESFVKRRAGVKDSGTLFGPSGGFLDLVDSLLVTVPAALITWPLLFSAAN